MNKFDSNQEWNFDLLQDALEKIEGIVDEELQLNTYKNQIEIISAEQMLDAYSAVGMPIYYDHWQFGKQFVRESEAYKRGRMGLAYEIVINSDPCISYLMEDNTMTMQCLVMAHACFGHNHFFKNNNTFKQWTDATAIIDYLVFAKHYIKECEERYGREEVEKVLDAAHALKLHGVDRYKRPASMSKDMLKARMKARIDYEQATYNDLWTTIPKSDKKDQKVDETERFPEEPEENLLYFIQKHAPNLPDWKREILRIVRMISQYFYPQMLTKVMNEGCATFTHYHVMNSMYDRGYATDGFMLEFLESHSGVLYQREGQHLNPYTLGFKMFSDIKRICINPTKEDERWFPNFAGSGDWVSQFKYAVENFKDESFILQYLSPNVIRDLSLFYILDDEQNPELYIKNIHNDQGYKMIREKLSESYNVNNQIPNIQVVNYNRWGDRQLTLECRTLKQRKLDAKEATKTLGHLVTLWGYDIKLVVIDDSGKELQTFRVGTTDIQI